MGLEGKYGLTAAAADLVNEGMLEDLLVYTHRAWRHVQPAEAAGFGGLGFLGAALDSRELSDGCLFVGLPGEHGDGRNYVGPALRNGAEMALTRPSEMDESDPLLAEDPGHDAAVLVCRNPAAALACLAAAWRRRHKVPAIAVTGSNGKTTTKDLIAAILDRAGATLATEGNYNNDLGLPLTLLGLRDHHRWAVLEMGASRPGDIDRLAVLAQPQVGVITNVAGVHLAGFGALEKVIATKGELLDHLPADGVAVLDRDSIGYEVLADRAPCRVLSWGEGPGVNRWSWSGGGCEGRFELDGCVFTSPLPGRHNAANCVAAIVAARALTGQDLDIDEALSHLRSSAHRSRLTDVAGVVVLDDTYNANPTSVMAAAVALRELIRPGRCFAVLGAMAELGDESVTRHRETGRELAALGFAAVWTLGPGAEALAEGAAIGGADGRHFTDIDSLVAALQREIAVGDGVLCKGSRIAGMERVVQAFRMCMEPKPGAGE